MVGTEGSNTVLPANALTPQAPSLWQILTAADKVLIVVVALGAAGLFVHQRGSVKEGGQVRIQTVDQVYLVPLTQVGVKDVEGPLGHSRIEIGTAGVRFSQAPCLHKICLQQGWIRFAGQVAACVPNRVILAVQGGAVANDLDAVSR